MEAILSSETSILTRATWHHISEDGIVQGKVSLKFSGKGRLRTDEILSEISFMEGRSATVVYGTTKSCYSPGGYSSVSHHADRARDRVKLCGIRGNKKRHWVGFCPSTTVSPANGSTDCSTLIFIRHAGLVQ
jgi:hypothetical protein